jgi:hypothetical protein
VKKVCGLSKREPIIFFYLFIKETNKNSQNAVGLSDAVSEFKNNKNSCSTEIDIRIEFFECVQGEGGGGEGVISPSNEDP